MAGVGQPGARRPRAEYRRISAIGRESAAYGQLVTIDSDSLDLLDPFGNVFGLVAVDSRDGSLLPPSCAWPTCARPTPFKGLVLERGMTGVPGRSASSENRCG